MKRYTWLMSLLVLMLSWAHAEPATTFKFETCFTTAAAFKRNLELLGAIPDPVRREKTFNAYWNRLVAERKVPFVTQNEVVFLYRTASAKTVTFDGEWSLGYPFLPDATPPLSGEKISGLDVWTGIRQFPSDGQIGYRIFVDNLPPVLDPANPLQQPESDAPRSELRMPRYVRSPWRDARPWVMKGNVTGNITFSSKQLGYPINYRVYTPYTMNPCPHGSEGLSAMSCTPRLGRTNGREYPVLFFSDGWEYLDFGMKNILDNLIAAQMIPPVIAVFMDPRDVVTGENNRGLQYFLEKEKTGAFITNELIPAIDAKYDTRRDRNGRAVVGFSLSGFFSSYLCFAHYKEFGLCAFQSSVPPVGDFAFSTDVGDLIANSPVLPVKIAIETGTIELGLTPDRQYRDFLQGKGYSIFYEEVSASHSWGNWADTIDEMLIYLLNKN